MDFSKIIGIMVGAILTVISMNIVFSMPTWLLWNWLMPDIFGLPTITIWQSIGLLILSNSLFNFNTITSTKAE